MKLTKIEKIEQRKQIADYAIESVLKGFKLSMKELFKKFDVDEELKAYIVEKNDFPRDINKIIEDYFKNE